MTQKKKPLKDKYDVDPKPDGVWVPIVRISRHIPFGYRVDPNDDKVLLPIEKELDSLEKARVFLRDYSMRDVALWLEQETGRKISVEGLRKRIRRDKNRRNKLAQTRYYARLYKEALEKAEKLEGRTGTASTGIYDYAGYEGPSDSET